MAVGFWTLNSPLDSTAIVTDDGRTFTYGQLNHATEVFAESISGPAKTLGFLLCRNTPECLIGYLASLRSGNAICLLDAELQDVLLNRLLEIYMPDWIFAMEQTDIPGYTRQQLSGGVFHRRTGNPSDSSIFPELALLLPTSGSTGSPRFVRLSYRNLQANACSIIGALGIKAEDRCITSLPMAYSYGLSVLNTHLLAGATLLMTTSGFLQREFWSFFRDQQPTSMAGVPYHYEVMLRTGMLEQELPSLKTLTQAGGRLAAERITQVNEIADRRSWRFFVMYGQTEATARISYVPPERLRQKIGSIGIAIPDGTVALDPDTKELLYSGPNVMLGYAEKRGDLSRLDDLKGALRTGDLGECDEDGYFYIVGRLKRFVKIFGKRFSLDEMEGLISRQVGHNVACFGVDDRVSVAVESSELAAAEIMKNVFHIHPTAFRIIKVGSLLRLPNGKIDYQALAEAAKT